MQFFNKSYYLDIDQNFNFINSGTKMPRISLSIFVIECRNKTINNINCKKGLINYNYHLHNSSNIYIFFYVHFFYCISKFYIFIVNSFLILSRFYNLKIIFSYLLSFFQKIFIFKRFLFSIFLQNFYLYPQTR